MPTEESPLLPTHNLPRIRTQGQRSPVSPQLRSHRRWRVPPPPEDPVPPKSRIRSLDLVLQLLLLSYTDVVTRRLFVYNVDSKHFCLGRI